MDRETPTRWPDAWVVGRVATTRPSLRLVCLPQAGAGSGSFTGWRAHLPVGVELAPVELPGRGTRVADELPGTVDELADQLHVGLAGEFRLPYLLFGHSFGGMLAYELARRIERDGGRAPLATVVAASRAPHVEPGDRLGNADGERLIRWLVAHDGIPRELFRFPDYLRSALSAIRADLALAEAHFVPSPVPLRSALHVLGGAEDRVVPPGALGAWSACAAGDFSLTVLDGGHDFPRTRPAAVLGKLKTILPPGTWPDEPRKVP
ncbi:alpha/beta fold hydrolase [Streptomyces sp. MN03-5084-2B]|nr:alpha/beta fold hydrolase [Streptomyces sp. MN03-5084-2B]